MRKLKKFSVFIFVIAAVGGYASGQQNNNSTQPGLINFVEGIVYLNNAVLPQDVKDLGRMKEGESLHTLDGRVEILLSPGVFLRVDEMSKIKMLSNRLLGTRVEIAAGSVLVECVEVHRYNEIDFLHNGAFVRLKKKGLYRIDTFPARLRVYDGEAEARLPFGAVADIKKGREVMLMTGANGKFNRKEEDNLTRWSHVRAEFLASVNLAAARALLNSDILWQLSAWRWSDHFHCYAYIPYNRGIHSYYGYRYWNPFEVHRTFAQYNYRPDNRGGNADSSGGVQNAPVGAGVGTVSAGEKAKKEPAKSKPAKVETKKPPLL